MPQPDSGRDSSPLSSIPDSDGYSLQLSQPTPPKPTEPSPKAMESTEDLVIPDVDPESHTMPPSRPKRARAAAPPKKEPPKKVAKRVKKTKTWDAESILTDPKSPLAEADLRSILCNPMAWDSLTLTDKQEILALLPPSTHLLTPTTPEEAKPDFAALKNDDTFRYDCATFTDNLAQGRFEEDWLESAWAAHQRRKMGDFDEFLWKKFEEVWETDLPEEMKVRKDGPCGKIQGSGKGGEDEEAGDELKSGRSEDGDLGKNVGDGKPKQKLVINETENLQVDSSPETTSPDQGKQTTAKAEDATPATPAKADSTKAGADSTTTEAQIDNDRMVIDELQEEGSQRTEKQSTPLVQRPNTMMDVDGEDSADELA